MKPDAESTPAELPVLDHRDHVLADTASFAEFQCKVPRRWPEPRAELPGWRFLPEVKSTDDPLAALVLVEPRGPGPVHRPY